MGSPGTARSGGRWPALAYSSSPRARVVDRIDTRDELFPAKLVDDRVEPLEHLGRRQVEPGVGAHRRTELSDQAGRAHATPGHVADHQRRPPGAEGDRVVPVPAHPGALDAGLVVGRDLKVLGLEPPGRQQAALERVSDRVLPRGGLAGDRRGGG